MEPRCVLGRRACRVLAALGVVERLGAPALLAADEVDGAAVDEREDPGRRLRPLGGERAAVRQTVRNASCTASSASRSSRSTRKASPKAVRPTRS